MDHHVVHEPLLLLVVLTVERVNKILGCDHWNKTTPTVLSRGTIYSVRSSNFGQNPMLRRFQWNLWHNATNISVFKNTKRHVLLFLKFDFTVHTILFLHMSVLYESSERRQARPRPHHNNRCHWFKRQTELGFTDKDWNARRFSFCKGRKCRRKITKSAQ